MSNINRIVCTACDGVGSHLVNNLLATGSTNKTCPECYGKGSVLNLAVVEEQPQDWHFTFGGDAVGYYVIYRGTFNSARLQMVRDFGLKWAFQYSELEGKEQVTKWSLKLYTGVNWNDR